MGLETRFKYAIVRTGENISSIVDVKERTGPNHYTLEFNGKKFEHQPVHPENLFTTYIEANAEIERRGR